MSSLDIEALLDSTANAAPVDQNGTSKAKDADDRHKSESSDRRDKDRARDGSRDRDRDRKRRERSRDRSRREANGDKELIATPTSENGSAHGSIKSRRRSRSRDEDRRHARRHSRDGDFYRGNGRARSRSRSPRSSYRPRDRRDRDDDMKPREDRRNGRRPSRSSKQETTPPLTEDETDRRTVFVQQLAARLRTKDLINFFEKIGPVKEAQIVKDRVSGRSKGYVCTSTYEQRMLTFFAVLVTLSSRMKNRSLLLFNSPDRSS